MYLCNNADCLGESGADRLQEDAFGAAADNFVLDGFVELLAVVGADVVLESGIILVRFLDVKRAILQLVDLKTHIAGLLADGESVIGDRILKESFVAGKGLDFSVKNFGNHSLVCK